MAKRRGGIDPMTFVTQQEGDGGGLKDLGALMGLLGLGEGQGEEERQSKAQQALQAYYEGQIAQQAAAGGRSKEELDIKRGELAGAAEERKAAAQERSAAEKYRQEQAAREMQAKEDLAAVNTLNQIMSSPDFTKEEKRAAAMKVNPRVAAGIQEEIAAAKKGRQEKFTTGLGKAYEGFGKDPKAIAAFLKTQEAVPDYEEMLKSADWQRLNQGMPAPAPGLLSRMFGGGGQAGGAPTVAAPLPEFRQSADYVPEWQQVEPVAGEYQPSAAFPRQGRAAVLPVDKVMEVAGVTGRNAGPPFVSAPGGPSAMPGAIEQPGFLENFLRQISDYTASRPERAPTERYPYPIGHGVPPTPPIDPRLLQ